MSHGPVQLRAPRDPRLKDGWRAAAVAFRRAYVELPHNPRRGNPHEAITAAIWALREVVANLSESEAMLEAVAAVHYASVIAPKWLYALYRPEPRK